MPRPLFEVEGLRVEVRDRDGAWAAAIRGVSLRLHAGEALALVGESASGKSLVLLGAFGLLPAGARAAGGRTRLAGVVFDPAAGRRRGRRRMSYADPEWARAVGRDVGFLFQDPVASWTPDLPIGEQAAEAVVEHHDLPTGEVERRLRRALGDVRLPTTSRLLRAFRHELSRGQAQRAMLAAALLRRPALLVADEPFTGLDTPAAAAIAELVDDLRRCRGMALLLATHDLGLVARLADRVAVVYAGRVVEEGPAVDVFRRPSHPYTSGLLGSIPGRGAPLHPVAGEAPPITRPPPGCAFGPRCPYAEEACRWEVPILETLGAGRVACRRAHLLDLPGVET